MLRLDQFLSRSFRPWFAPGTRAEEEPVFEISEHAMEAEEGGGFEDHCSAKKPARTEKGSPEPEEETVQRMEVRGSSAGSLQHLELVLEEQVLGEEGPSAAAFEEVGRPEKQV